MVILAAIVGIVVAALVLFVLQKKNHVEQSQQKPPERPLLKYSYESLRTRTYKGGPIVIETAIKETPLFVSRIFFFTADGKKISGLINIPKERGFYPVIVMLRGYVDQAAYTTGEGTQHAGEFFAQHGFITLAPDFLGYGKSDKAPDDNLEERFTTYVAVAELLGSVKNLPNALKLSGNETQVATDKIGIWGHSNGGQIALSTLEITGGAYPTILWAPVSKPFPESVLHYADELDDHGKKLRGIIDRFQRIYDATKFSPTTYFSWIKAPIQLYQGEKDEEVPRVWSDELYEKLRKLGVSIEYFTYPNEDHNFTKEDWPQIVQKNIEFYARYLKTK